MLGVLVAIGRWRMMQPLVRFFFDHMTDIFLKERLTENEHWVAFLHPKPSYPLHILILPKQALATLVDSPEDQPALFSSLFKLVKTLIERYALDVSGYRLITNGGPNQSIPQWHWHLISEKAGEVDA